MSLKNEAAEEGLYCQSLIDGFGNVRPILPQKDRLLLSHNIYNQFYLTNYVENQFKNKPSRQESTKVRITQKTEKERGNSYKKKEEIFG